jgi:hypothetical protein
MGNTIVSADDNMDESARHLMKAAGNAIDSEQNGTLEKPKHLSSKLSAIVSVILAHSWVNLE